eukprot:SAG11_NODE_7834_length_1090_cov_3.310797_1_plen_282_part_01
MYHTTYRRLGQGPQGGSRLIGYTEAWQAQLGSSRTKPIPLYRMADLQEDPVTGQSKIDPASSGGTSKDASPNQDSSAGGVSTPGSVKLGTPGKRPAVQFSPMAGYTPGTSSTSKRQRSSAVTHTVSLNEAIAFDASFEEEVKGHKENNSGAPSTVARLSPPTVARPFPSEHVSHARLCEKGSEATHPGVLSHDTGEQEDDDAGPPGITANEPGAPAYSPPRASPPCENLSLNKLVANRAVGFPAVDSRVLRHETNPEKNYSVQEKEALGIIYGVKKFRHYLL